MSHFEHRILSIWVSHFEHFVGVAFCGSILRHLGVAFCGILRHFASHFAEKIMDYVLSCELKKEKSVQQDTQKNINLTTEQKTITVSEESTYLAVPYREKNQAKQLGAKWDKHAKSWYVPQGIDTTSFNQWLLDILPSHMKLAQNPRVEFKDALVESGFNILGLPVMDGTMQRVSVEGDKPQQKSGAYIGYLDGHPAGMIQNWNSGVKFNELSQK